MLDLVCINPDQIEQFWPHAAPFIKTAIHRAALTDFADLEQAALDGRALLWLVTDGATIEAAVLTQLVGRNCRILACAGRRMDRWLMLKDRIEQYARDEGCKAVQSIGRMGWKRVLADYTAKYVVLEKELDDAK